MSGEQDGNVDIIPWSISRHNRLPVDTSTVYYIHIHRISLQCQYADKNTVVPVNNITNI